jgi:hypothetical protein
MDFLQKFGEWTILRKEAIGTGVTVLFSLFAATAFATPGAPISTGIPVLSNAAGATALLCNIMGVMFWILISCSIIMVLWGAYLYVFAGDDAQRPSQAKMALLYAVIGIVVALGAKGFPLVVASIFPGTSVSRCGS